MTTTTTKKLLGAAAFSLVLAGGGAAGALLGTPVTSGAQEEPTSTTSDDGAETAADEVRFRHHGEHLAVAAEALGMTEDELRTALEGGSTIADVAASEGVDLDAVIDALVADATEQLRERITAMVNGELPERGFHVHGPGPGLEVAAESLGMTEDELRAALEDGSSLADVAAAQSIDVQTLIDAMVAEATSRLDEAVASGDLTRERADELQAELGERITALVNGELGFRGGPGGPRHHRGGFGGPRGDIDRADQPASDEA